MSRTPDPTPSTAARAVRMAASEGRPAPLRQPLSDTAQDRLALLESMRQLGSIPSTATPLPAPEDAAAADNDSPDDGSRQEEGAEEELDPEAVAQLRHLQQQLAELKQLQAQAMQLQAMKAMLEQQAAAAAEADSGNGSGGDDGADSDTDMAPAATTDATNGSTDTPEDGASPETLARERARHAQLRQELEQQMEALRALEQQKADLERLEAQQQAELSMHQSRLAQLHAEQAAATHGSGEGVPAAAAPAAPAAGTGGDDGEAAGGGVDDAAMQGRVWAMMQHMEQVSAERDRLVQLHQSLVAEKERLEAGAGEGNSGDDGGSDGDGDDDGDGGGDGDGLADAEQGMMLMLQQMRQLEQLRAERDRLLALQRQAADGDSGSDSDSDSGGGGASADAAASDDGAAAEQLQQALASLQQLQQLTAERDRLVERARELEAEEARLAAAEAADPAAGAAAASGPGSGGSGEDSGGDGAQGGRAVDMDDPVAMRQMLLQMRQEMEAAVAAGTATPEELDSMREAFQLAAQLQHFMQERDRLTALQAELQAEMDAESAQAGGEPTTGGGDGRGAAAAAAPPTAAPDDADGGAVPAGGGDDGSDEELTAEEQEEVRRLQAQLASLTGQLSALESERDRLEAVRNTMRSAAADAGMAGAGSRTAAATSSPSSSVPEELSDGGDSGGGGGGDDDDDFDDLSPEDRATLMAQLRALQAQEQELESLRTQLAEAEAAAAEAEGQAPPATRPAAAAAATSTARDAEPSYIQAALAQLGMGAQSAAASRPPQQPPQVSTMEAELREQAMLRAQLSSLTSQLSALQQQAMALNGEGADAAADDGGDDYSEDFHPSGEEEEQASGPPSDAAAATAQAERDLQALGEVRDRVRALRRWLEHDELDPSIEAVFERALTECGGDQERLPQLLVKHLFGDLPVGPELAARVLPQFATRGGRAAAGAGAGAGSSSTSGGSGGGDGDDAAPSGGAAASWWQSEPSPQRPKTSRRVSNPTPSEFHDYVSPRSGSGSPRGFAAADAGAGATVQRAVFDSTGSDGDANEGADGDATAATAGPAFQQQRPEPLSDDVHVPGDVPSPSPSQFTDYLPADLHPSPEDRSPTNIMRVHDSDASRDAADTAAAPVVARRLPPAVPPSRARGGTGASRLHGGMSVASVDVLPGSSAASVEPLPETGDATAPRGSPTSMSMTAAVQYCKGLPSAAERHLFLHNFLHKFDTPVRGDEQATRFVLSAVMAALAAADTSPPAAPTAALTPASPPPSSGGTANAHLHAQVDCMLQECPASVDLVLQVVMGVTAAPTPVLRDPLFRATVVERLRQLGQDWQPGVTVPARTPPRSSTDRLRGSAGGRTGGGTNYFLQHLSERPFDSPNQPSREPRRRPWSPAAGSGRSGGREVSGDRADYTESVDGRTATTIETRGSRRSLLSVQSRGSMNTVSSAELEGDSPPRRRRDRGAAGAQPPRAPAPVSAPTVDYTESVDTTTSVPSPMRRQRSATGDSVSTGVGAVAAPAASVGGTDTTRGGVAAARGGDDRSDASWSFASRDPAPHSDDNELRSWTALSGPSPSPPSAGASSSEALTPDGAPSTPSGRGTRVADPASSGDVTESLLGTLQYLRDLRESLNGATGRTPVFQRHQRDAAAIDRDIEQALALMQQGSQSRP